MIWHAGGNNITVMIIARHGASCSISRFFHCWELRYPTTKGRVLIILGLRAPDQIDQLGELLSQQWIKEALKCSRTTEHELNTFMPLLSPTFVLIPPTRLQPVLREEKFLNT
uniref:Uncharacterized protein n=1 Tax=Coccidioides posadasii RMSCC 3488 TaxID=454284 RepID=A0A0J6ETJ3_COCPO|nr:hypothetical protein CPAG_00185 [Coccidioides posadasii RMSCC 3488]